MSTMRGTLSDHHIPRDMSDVERITYCITRTEQRVVDEGELPVRDDAMVVVPMPDEPGVYNVMFELHFADGVVQATSPQQVVQE